MRNNQKVLVLGGTGSIGGAVAEVLQQRGHHVTCLARSKNAEEKLQSAGFETIPGDIRTPDQWTACAPGFDAVVHAAITWSDDMAEVDQQLTTALLSAFATPDASKTVIYTNGCWAYGNTGDHVATEDSPFDSRSDFEWSLETTRQVSEDRNIRGMVIYPAMVYEHDGGVLESMVADARERNNVRVVGDPETRWTFVHRMDLAVLYSLMLESAEQGSHYNGAGIVSMEIGKIARVIARRYGKSVDIVAIPVEQAQREFGSWIEGYALDQQMTSDKAKRDLGWMPEHTDILTELSQNP